MKTKTPVRISVLDKNDTINFAADELCRYLSKLTDGNCTRSDDAHEDCIQLGLMSSFADIKVPDVKDPTLDDAVYVDTKGSNGYIAGINPRSVLLAVYKYLTELGCRWVRPGELGEYIPRLNSLPDVSLTEVPSYRHRGVCIEGAVSYQNVRDMIDFIPKLGFNSYFIQFREAHIFFNRWYNHRGNPLAEAEEVSIERAQAYTYRLSEEIKQRGLLYHGVGHGWTCEPLGIRGLGWEPHKGEISGDVSKYFALVNGERKLAGGVVMNTNLCYSNPEVRHMMVEEIISYAKMHPEIDLLHFWLADGANCMCECSECAKSRTSDFYVEMLNMVDARLTEEGMDTRIVFIIYVDILWPPIEKKIANPDRFFLLFAPIERTYSSSFISEKELPPLPVYECNKLKMPKSVEENVTFLNAWQGVFSGDAFDFDYHLMWDHYNDPGYIQISKILSQDIKALKNIGLNGYMSCQTNRSFLPTALPITVMGRTLWNSGLSLDEISDDYFSGAFGPDWKPCRDYLTELSLLFDPVYLRGEKTVVDPKAAENFGKVAGVVQQFLPTIERNMKSKEAVWAESWRLLSFHSDICMSFAEILKYRAEGNDEKARELWQGLKQMLRENEPLIQPVFDVRLFMLVFGDEKFHYDLTKEHY